VYGKDFFSVEAKDHLDWGMGWGYTTGMTNEQATEIAETFFLDLIEGRSLSFDIDAYSSQEITVIFAKIAAKFATYAGDAIDF